MQCDDWLINFLLENFVAFARHREKKQLRSASKSKACLPSFYHDQFESLLGPLFLGHQPAFVGAAFGFPGPLSGSSPGLFPAFSNIS